MPSAVLESLQEFVDAPAILAFPTTTGPGGRTRGESA
jgi:hypothetical protein